MSHRAAAALHGFDNFLPGSAEFTVPRSRRGIARSWTVHTSASLPLIDLSTVDGLRATSASRTVVDLAATDIGLDRLGDAIDSAVRLGLSSPALLRRRIAALRSSGRARSSQPRCA